MLYFRRLLIFFIAFSLFSCGKNDKTNEEKPDINTEKQIPPVNSELQQNNTIYKSPEDSIRAVKNSMLRMQKYKKKKEIVNVNGEVIETSEPTTTPSNEPKSKKTPIPSFVYIKKILNRCEIGVPMTQKELQTNFNIPEEAIQLVKSVTKISPNELDIKWKSTWLIEKVSDAKFKDGRMKMRFDKNKMYTSGGAIGIKHNKKTYTDLIIIGRNAYIPSVKGYHWQIGKD
jgi:hypothetical protein